MTSFQFQNYLRTNRKRLALFQDEVAFLMGAQSGTKISRYERFATTPSLETALAFEVIFQKPIRELFAGLYERIEKEVMVRAEELIQMTDAEKSSGKTIHKHETLTNIITGNKSTL